MIASVLIEYSVKSLDKTFDYIVKEELLSDIKIGQKVLVPFGNTIVEGFVMSLSISLMKILNIKKYMK